MMFGMGLVPFETRVPQSCSACHCLEVNPHSDEAYCMREDGRPIRLRRGQRRPRWCPNRCQRTETTFLCGVIDEKTEEKDI